MKKMVPIAKQHNFSIIYKGEQKSLKNLLSKKLFYSILKEASSRIIDNFIFLIKILKIRHSIVLFVHPQATGFEVLLKLIRNNRVYFYVMDNSYFCLRSYNINPYTNKECLICVKDPSKALDECTVFPEKCTRERKIKYLQDLRDISHEVFFLAQNQKQKELLILHFGDSIRCSIVGLDTGELIGGVGFSEFDDFDESYDLVFHGATHLAKGVGYFVELASLLPEYICFIPSSRNSVEHLLGRKIALKNVIFQECSWENGLKEAVVSAKLVINPSLWSSPVEGALLKSIFFNGNVAVVETEYGFSQEIIASSNILALPLDVIRSSRAVRSFLVGGCNISKDTKEWVTNYLHNNDMTKVFEAISRDAGRGK